MRVGIIDYGSGNIRSVYKSFEKASSLLGKNFQIQRRVCYGIWQVRPDQAFRPRYHVR